MSRTDLTIRADIRLGVDATINVSGHSDMAVLHVGRSLTIYPPGYGMGRLADLASLRAFAVTMLGAIDEALAAMAADEALAEAAS